MRQTPEENDPRVITAATCSFEEAVTQVNEEVVEGGPRWVCLEYSRQSAIHSVVHTHRQSSSDEWNSSGRPFEHTDRLAGRTRDDVYDRLRR